MAHTTDPERVEMSSQRLARIRPAMQAWVERGTLAGASAMLARRGKIVYADQVGKLAMETDALLGEDAIFRIYSMTKPIVCTALMTLYEEGRFQLVTPVSQFIPALGKVKVLQQDAGVETEVDLQRPITVRDLMAHTAGFTYDFLVDSPVAEHYRQAELLHNCGRTLEQFVDELVRLPLAYQPGSRWHYGLGIDVAAHLIERIVDQPLRQFLQERIFGPLGMVDTDFCVPAAKQARLAAMYGVGDIAACNMTHLKMFAAWEAGVLECIDPSDSYPLDQPQTFQRGGHGLYSTTADYMRFALMLLNNGELDGARVLGRKTLELMHANHIPSALLPWEVGGEPSYGYGFGLGSRTLMDVGAAGIPGSVGEFGWGGAASTYYWVDPHEELAGVFMTQYQGADAPSADFRVLAYQAIID
jgi:CubicO group peptidase (beta-lactamase class C family)